MPNKCTYISVVSTAHLNISVTSQSDQKLSKNQTEDQQDAMIVIKLPAKRSASNPSWVKAGNDKSPTIVTPSLTVEHQSRHFPLGTAAVTNARPVGTGEHTLSVPSGETALQSPSLTGSYEGIALAKPPLVKEITVRIPKSKSLIHQGASAKTKDLTDPVQETPTDRNEGARTGQVMPKVHMYEVPDQEDNTSFMMNMKTKFTPTIETTVTSPMVVEPSWVDVKLRRSRTNGLNHSGLNGLYAA